MLALARARAMRASAASTSASSFASPTASEADAAAAAAACTPRRRNGGAQGTTRWCDCATSGAEALRVCCDGVWRAVGAGVAGVDGAGAGEGGGGAGGDVLGLDEAASGEEPWPLTALGAGSGRACALDPDRSAACGDAGAALSGA